MEGCVQQLGGLRPAGRLGNCGTGLLFFCISLLLFLLCFVLLKPNYLAAFDGSLFEL